MDRKARSEWYAYGDNCIKQSLAIPEDPPKRVAGPNTRITRAFKTREWSIQLTNANTKDKATLTATRRAKISWLHHPSHFTFDTGESYRVGDKTSARYSPESPKDLHRLFNCPLSALSPNCVLIFNRGDGDGNGSVGDRLLLSVGAITTAIEGSG